MSVKGLEKSTVLTVVFRCVVMNPCFDHGYETTQNTSRLRLKYDKHSIEAVKRLCLLSIVSQNGTHSAHTLEIVQNRNRSAM